MQIDINSIKSKLDQLPDVEKMEILRLLDELESAKTKETAHEDFLGFVKHVWPAFIEGDHHRVMADAFNRIAKGELKRLIVNMPPRHTKSEFASHLFPAWYLGKYPDRKVIQTAHTAELAVGFGRKVRNLVGSDDYQHIFNNVSLASDSKAAGRWSTNKNGEYFAIGVGGAVTGKGADILIIDDPHSEQEAALNDPSIYDKTYEWYTSGPRQRLQPGGSICVVMTRWSKKDLTGQILKSSIQRGGSDEWEVIELPAILPSGSPLWPGFWPLEQLEALRSELPVPKWSAQYQQDPTSEEGALIKREWWKEWDKKSPPRCDFVIQSWDTAFLAKETADYSACTTWGVFYDDDGNSNIILLDALQERLEFPDLKARALDMYKEFEPDAFIVEAKASGSPLIFELVDSGTQALLRFRQGGFISIDSDEKEEEFYRHRRAAYY